MAKKENEPLLSHGNSSLRSGVFSRVLGRRQVLSRMGALTRCAYHHLAANCAALQNKIFDKCINSRIGNSLLSRKETIRKGLANTFRQMHRKHVKFVIVSAAVTLFCTFQLYVFMSLYAIPFNVVQIWSNDTNQIARVKILLYNKTSIYEPSAICPKTKDQPKLFLLIVVCSATYNQGTRQAIRDTWGSHVKYLKLSKIYNSVKQQYRNYDFSYSLLETKKNVSKNKKSYQILGYKDLLPKLAKVLKRKDNINKRNIKTQDEKLDEVIDTHVHNYLGDIANITNIDEYDHINNVMKIPKNSKNTLHLNSIIAEFLEKQATKRIISDRADNAISDFKLVFLLGLPAMRDDKMEREIALEVEEYNDIIQEKFLDSYSNLTLKSIMMLKWVTNNCRGAIRYILKTDDDVYVNIPNLMNDLRVRSRAFDKRAKKDAKLEEHLLIGDLISGASPVHNYMHKWHSPLFLFSGYRYPPYLSGTAYVFTQPTARALYRAVWTTKYFHLEDIFITGMVSKRAKPPIKPTDDERFTFRSPRSACSPHEFATSHHINTKQMYWIVNKMMSRDAVEFCEKTALERIRLSRELENATARASKKSLRTPFFYIMRGNKRYKVFRKRCIETRNKWRRLKIVCY